MAQEMKFAKFFKDNYCPGLDSQERLIKEILPKVQEQGAEFEACIILAQVRDKEDHKRKVQIISIKGETLLLDKLGAELQKARINSHVELIESILGPMPPELKRMVLKGGALFG